MFKSLYYVFRLYSSIHLPLEVFSTVQNSMLLLHCSNSKDKNNKILQPLPSHRSVRTGGSRERKQKTNTFLHCSLDSWFISLLLPWVPNAWVSYWHRRSYFHATSLFPAEAPPVSISAQSLHTHCGCWQQEQSIWYLQQQLSAHEVAPLQCLCLWPALLSLPRDMD